MQSFVVTGASTGIGRATAIKLGRDGVEVFLLARDVMGLKETARQVEANGGVARVMMVDLAETASLEKAIQSIREQVTSITGVFNIAGVWHGPDEVYAGKDLATFKTETIRRTYEVGLVAPTLLVHGLLPKMAKGSVVVNLSGTFEDGAKGWLPYYVSKRAIEDLTVGLAQEMDGKEIRVYGVSPSDVATEAYRRYFPEYTEDALTPEQVADLLASLVNGERFKSGDVVVIKKGLEPFVGFHA